MTTEPLQVITKKMTRLFFFSMTLFHVWQPLIAQTNFEKIDNVLSEQLDRGASGSFYLREGTKQFQRSVGEANRQTGVKNRPNTAFQTGSVSKVFTAVAILQLAQANKLSLEDRVIEYLPDFTQSKVKISHLLSHTSGIPEKEELFLKSILAGDTSKKYGNSDIIPAIKKLENPLAFEPGTQWRYCNMGYSLLGMIVEKISGQSLASYLSTSIFQPADMENSFLSGHRAYDEQAKGYMVRARYEGAYILAVDHKNMRPWSFSFTGFEGCTNIWSTVVDLEKFDLALRKNILLNKTYTDLMYSPVKLANGQPILIPGEFGPANFGLGWFLPINEQGGKIVMHGGIEPGFFSMFWRDLTNDRTIILLDNQQSEGFGLLTANSIALLTDKKIIENRPNMRSLYLEYVRTMHHKGIEQAEEFLTKNVKDALNFYRSEHELNDLGLELSDDGHHQKALKVLKTATIVYPQSWNVFDSYGKALLAAGKKKEAIEMYRQSLQLNPKNEEAIAILTKLEAEH